MNDQNSEQITCKCPRGHKLRGATQLIGKSVRCPRCSEKFVFGYHVRETVSDTAVVRMLGDAPAAPPMPETVPTMRPCSRCGIAISASSSVCEHCNCYVGVQPDFMAKLGGKNQANSN